MPKSKPVPKYKELTEDELEMIHWRATRGCHFEGGFLFASEYGKEVIQNDVPLLIAEVRRLRGSLTQRAADVCPGCDGTGTSYPNGPEPEMCERCDGTGHAANASR